MIDSLSGDEFVFLFLFSLVWWGSLFVSGVKGLLQDNPTVLQLGSFHERGFNFSGFDTELVTLIAEVGKHEQSDEEPGVAAT